MTHGKKISVVSGNVCCIDSAVQGKVCAVCDAVSAYLWHFAKRCVLIYNYHKPLKIKL